ncbi:Acyl-CoA synthetase (AMP-forming)/AMP-acid ligase II [Frankia canadensis]|uniref:Acyl-CoA synthetase (AMP-forming)/AMP-acid ligase II n=1 Tax=Frankia canadensis TaxID=1836972 RepID=A0A2I2KMG5_9ACTN|nr:AMP-binding protein [Frankia canadensis]SNQ46854.1 Acyl-CoA synthetase (AMP-forming)/AMP-acid ligase II [Frankia canadensis]SOU54144.1 Acyl-CoA synthetase (AMP-forming)/AMP-acid ligase II [Frankia canadensis]
MHLGMLLEMAADGLADRTALGPAADGPSFAELGRRARRLGAALAARPGTRIGLIDLNSPAVPLTLFGSAIAGKPFVPINYRLADPQLRAIVARTAPATIIVGDGVAERVGPVDGIEYLTRAEALMIAADPDGEQGDGWGGDADDIAVLLFTSGTTGEPKAAVLRHSNLTEYIITTVEFGGAAEDEAAIVSVPPYHIAGISAVLSSTYSGRRVVQLEAFDPKEWVELVRAESVTQAMVVPTMLGRILDIVEADGQGLPSLRSLSYGGGPMPLPVIERAVGLLPHVGFVNAYGLTETSSTIAVLGPDDHHAAFASTDPAVRARLASVGRPLPTLEVSIRDAAGELVPTGERGEICVRGGQVSGEYLGRGTTLDADGWFPTRDEGHLDDAGYLFVHGRLDDVIVRGGENLSPGEIEAVLLEHPAVLEAAVVGIPNKEWGEQVAAAVVIVGEVSEDELKAHVRARLRSSRTPDRIQFRADLPFNESGKLLRRVLRTELADAFA